MMRATEMERMEQKDQKIRKYEDGSEKVIGALVEVHRALGPGLLESAYEACFCRELELRGLSFERQRPITAAYKGLLYSLTAPRARESCTRSSAR